MWQLGCVLSLPYLLAATAIAFPSRTNNDPPQAAFGVQSESPTPESNQEWGSPPNPNSTHHLIFNSVSGLLQRWPNALHRNGASLYICALLAVLIFLRQVTALFPRQSQKGQFYTTGVRTTKSQFQLIGLRSTLITLTCSVVHLAI